MKLWGITGGIGMGKSTTASFLEAKGHPVIDTDVLARDVVKPGEPSLQQIRETFGEAILSSEGSLNRSALASIVFQDPAALKKLESILHPAIRERWVALAQQWKEQGKPHGFVVIPLLYETGAESQFDHLLCVACSAVSQSARLKSRGWTEEESRRRQAAQWPVAKKMEKAEFVLWTEGSLAVHEQQLDGILARVQP